MDERIGLNGEIFNGILSRFSVTMEVFTNMGSDDFPHRCRCIPMRNDHQQEKLVMEIIDGESESFMLLSID